MLYCQEFNIARKIWLQSLPNLGDGAKLFNKEQFITGLIPILQLKVESKEPTTYYDVERRAHQKYHKLKCLEEESMPIARPREVLIQINAAIPIPTIPMAIRPST